MEHSEFAEQREDLLQSIKRDEEEVRVAMRDLTGAAGFQLDVSERIRKFPLSWTIGALFVGLWLGSRRARVDVAGERRS